MQKHAKKPPSKIFSVSRALSVKTMNIGEFIKSVAVMLYLLIAAPFAYLVKLITKPLERTSNEVEVILLEMSSGKVDDYGWDYFLNVPIKDQYLDSIRERTEVLWEYDEFLTNNKDGDLVLNAKGLAELQGLINELRSENT